MSINYLALILSLVLGLSCEFVVPRRLHEESNSREFLEGIRGFATVRLRSHRLDTIPEKFRVCRVSSSIYSASLHFGEI